MDRKSLETFKGRRVQLVKKNNFVIDGEIKNVFTDSIEFFTKGKLILLSFDRIGEISPLKPINGGGHHS